MPIYEYRCSACGDVVDALQKMSDPPLSDCPECGQADTLKKLLSAHVVGSARSSRRAAPMPAGCGQCENPHPACGLPN